MKKIRAFIVDDSAVVRQAVKEILESDPGIEVIGVASDPIFAHDKMVKDWPDVIVMDLEMPRMDGLTYLRQIMSQRPTPVVICSSLSEKGAQVTAQALSAGAVDVITKPQGSLKNFFQQSRDDLIGAVRAAASANIKQTGSGLSGNTVMPPPMPRPQPGSNGLAAGVVPEKLTADAILSAPGSATLGKTTEKVVAIGTSTGGTQALEAVLTQIPRTCTGIVVVQHMPEKFTGAFAARLNSICQIEVKEAENNDRVLPGRALIAPGGKHMLLKLSGAQYVVEIVDGPLVSRHKPSVDVLFRSVAKFAGRNALGIIMTGMGDDGARGMLEMHQAGAHTIAQDESTCVVYGMPKEAVKLGAVDESMPLGNIPKAITNFH